MEILANKELQLAFEYANYTNKNIFLTGKAGTGKTTFLRHLKQTSFKRMIVVAPTGVAAINAAGVTIHSFFQLPFGPFIPTQYHTSNQNSAFRKFDYKISKLKINIIKSLDLLVIDEISMVRADLLDHIDEVLRRYRNKYLPFGGVQLLMIGDLQQLPPVAREEEWMLIQQYYPTPFFFDSLALKKATYITIELKEVFRQQDETFIKLLNRIRNNIATPEDLEEINKHYIPNFNTADAEGFITLTTHNHLAKKINQHRLLQLKTKEKKFEAAITGDFPEHMYPNDYELILKTGAQVMFNKNDLGAERRFYNGKIGIIETIDEDGIFVRDLDNEEILHVPKVVWENTVYSMDEKTMEIKEKIVGTFRQYPLKLAWAITIHKSQGLTFDKVIIDANAAFDHGQVYVAFSRCRTLDGIVLSSAIDNNSIRCHKIIQQFNRNIEENPIDEQQLSFAQHQYQQQLILELFNVKDIERFLTQCKKLTTVFKESTPVTITEILDKLEKNFEEIKTVAKRFNEQLQEIMQETLTQKEKNDFLQERISKASSYFEDIIEKNIYSILLDFDTDVDNKALRKPLSELVKNAIEKIKTQIALFQICKTGFDLKKFLRTRAIAAIEKEDLSKKKTESEVYSDNILHPKLLKELKNWRNNKAKELNTEFNKVLSQKVLIKLTNELPAHTSQLKLIKGFGKKRIQELGHEICEIITQYMLTNNIPIPEDEAKTEEKKLSSKEITFQLYKSGKNIDEIAKERGMAVSTISEHLTEFIAKGELKIESMMNAVLFNKIAETAKQHNTTKLAEIKAKLPEEVNWHEIRWALAAMKIQNTE